MLFQFRGTSSTHYKATLWRVTAALLMKEGKSGLEKKYSNLVKRQCDLRSKNKTNDEKLDLLIDMMRELKDDQKQRNQEQVEIKKEIKRDKLGKVYKRLEWIKKEKKKNNVVVMSWKINTDDVKILKNDVVNMIKNQLEIQTQVKSVQKLGEKTCLVQFEKEEDKEIVMKNKYKLKNNKRERIFINEDMTKMEREKEKHIRRVAKEERERGKVVKIGYNKITINGKEWRWNYNTTQLESTDQKN
ncbi:hypothetical protein MML48_2g00015507 [Holotrichia oblita]|uniref:Uncharacterized protein n=1 Tax=Holotrichia oblita TaxID=644536 RepID=A0ACB9TJD0_HOLOL|nr:hypothetical protein MML48_2g00015507 [Holotrichia oblita]